MESMTVRPVGHIRFEDEMPYIQLLPEYADAARGLEGFGHICVTWWFDKCDNEEARAKLVEDSPYKKGPARLGTFATRSPERPNPIAITMCPLADVDMENARIKLWYIDAMEGTPVLDIKPYSPCLDRVRDISSPGWCSHWPEWMEDSAEFDWEAEFNF